jgi:hypothetical protein
MMDMAEDNLALRAAALAGVVQNLIECQDLLDGYSLHIEAAHIDAALNGLRSHVPVHEPSFEVLMLKLKLVDRD